MIFWYPQGRYTIIDFVALALRDCEVCFGWYCRYRSTLLSPRHASCIKCCLGCWKIEFDSERSDTPQELTFALPCTNLLSSTFPSLPVIWLDLQLRDCTWMLRQKTEWRKSRDPSLERANRQTLPTEIWPIQSPKFCPVCRVILHSTFLDAQ